MKLLSSKTQNVADSWSLTQELPYIEEENNYSTLTLRVSHKTFQKTVPATRFFLAIPFLLPTFELAQTDNPLLVWLLIAVIAGIILIFVLIVFILLPLSRRPRTATNKSPQPLPPVQPPLSEPAVDTLSTPPTDIQPADSQESDSDTEPSLPVVVSVAEPSTVPISGQRPASIKWQIAGLSDVGLRRELNEDNLLMIEGEMVQLGPYGLYVVADGLGGHEAGEIASQLAVEAVERQHAQNPPTITAAPFEEWLRDAVMMANESVLHYQTGHTGTEKMGSTLVMALMVDGKAHIANVGDSRAYHLNSQSINQITVDHSLVERLVQIGQITREEARTHKQRNVIYSIIGEKNKLEISYYHLDLSPGDRLLLCSDGLSGMVTDEEVLKISQNEADPGKASQMMVEAAKQAGGHDNITTIIIQMDGN